MRKAGKAILLFPIISVVVVFLAILLVNLAVSEPSVQTAQQVRYLKPYTFQHTTEPQIFLYPDNPSPGDFLIVEVAPLIVRDPVQIEFSFSGNISNHYRVGENYYAVIGISYDTLPGSYTVTVKADQGLSSDPLVLVSKEMAIGAKDFYVSRFRVPPSATVGWTAERLAADREKVRLARETTEPQPLWLQGFMLPLVGRITSEYATIRYINDNPPRRHNGIDIATDEGVPVVTAGSGIVRLSEFLLSGGNTVIIDHGLKLSSTYMHLETILIKTGETVERGEQIGTVGMTGYANGPHLHWEVNIGQAPVNPMQLLDNDLLWVPPAYVNTMIE
ncbi:MAG: M23 family metallopeptidase [Firmicutes bacterium]|nr:M23 family metallopeptidase [Bacillota bacterium]